MQLKNLIYFLLLVLSINVDCFFSALTEGFLLAKRSLRILKVSISFGLTQAFLLLVGYFVGSFSLAYVSKFDHYVAFFLLLFVGVHMIYEEFKGKEVEEKGFSKDFKSLIAIAFATSIDALAVGLVTALILKRVFLFTLGVFFITFVVTSAGMLLGVRFSGLVRKFRYAQTVGGVVLIILGVKILLEHLGVF